MTTCELKDKAMADFMWVLKCIHSCQNTFQIDCALHLVQLFYYKYKDDTLSGELLLAHKYKYADIHCILN